MWESEDSDTDFNLAEASKEPSHSQLSDAVPKLLEFICIFLFSWQAIFKVSDFAITIFIKFFKALLCKLSDISQWQVLKQLHKIFPNTLIQAFKLKSINRDKFSRFVVCQLCHSTYMYNDLMQRTNREMVKCSFIPFPRHCQMRMRMPCSHPLLKKVKAASGNQILRPLKIFCYSSCIDYIQDLIQQPGIPDLLNHWRDRKIPSGVMADVYDGSVWKSFKDKDDKYFFEARYNLGLLLNIDWFQPYLHVKYSVGAIYLVTLNFPRHLRYRKENMILVGIIPGPNEPKLTLNSYLEPLVLDMIKLWKGIDIVTVEGKEILHAAILCNSSDIPACRKVGGFVGHSAIKACSRCLKSFPTEKFGDKADYSGYNRDTWAVRTVTEHRTEGFSWKHANSLSERSTIERNFGVRFTELLRLDYFDTVRFSVIDPMHNMFLGTAKRMVGIWKEKGMLSPEIFDKTQALVDRFVVPPDVGIIPHKISSGFASFTADQWKNWTILFSLVALKDILPSRHYECWSLFVQACNLTCSKALSEESVTALDQLLVGFCQRFEQIIGPDLCTINMHLHCHLQKCILDYGPPNSFWLFGCERMNGLLGSVPTNHHDIEMQIMRKFISSKQIMQLLSGNHDEVFKDLFATALYSKGSLQFGELPELPLPSLSLSSLDIINNFCKFLPPIKEDCFSSDELLQIDGILKSSFGENYVRSLMLYKHSPALHINNIVYGSINSIHSKSALTYAKNMDENYAPGCIMKYLEVTMMVTKTDIQKPVARKIFMAIVHWLDEHEKKNWYGKPVEVWNSYVTGIGSITPIPVANILCHCAYVMHEIDFNTRITEPVTVVVPINYFNGL